MLFPEVENKRLFNDPLEGDLYLLVACVYRLDKDSVYAKAGTSDDVSVDLVAHGDRVVYVASLSRSWHGCSPFSMVCRL